MMVKRRITYRRGDPPGREYRVAELAMKDVHQLVQNHWSNLAVVTDLQVIRSSQHKELARIMQEAGYESLLGVSAAERGYALGR
jgi:hypothetical protein